MKELRLTPTRQKWGPCLWRRWRPHEEPGLVRLPSSNEVFLPLPAGMLPEKAWWRVRPSLSPTAEATPNMGSAKMTWRARMFKLKEKRALTYVAQLVGHLPPKTEGCLFNSQSGHMPGLQVPSRVGACWRGNWSMFLSHIDDSFPLFLSPFSSF